MQSWVIYALVAFIGYFFVNFLFKYVSSENPLLVSMILYSTAGIVMFIILASKMDFSISKRSLIISILIGICSVIATIFALKSIKISPNPGYSNAIYSANFVLVTIISAFVFGSSLNVIKFLGILATLLGLILLSI